MQLSIKQQLVLAFSALAFFSVISTALLIGQSSISQSEQSLRLQVEEKLIALRDLKKLQIEEYFLTLEHQVENMSRQPWVLKASQELTQSAKNFVDESNIESSSLKTFYSAQFDEKYKSLNAGTSSNVNNIYSSLDDVARSMQASYISNNPHALGEKDLLISSASGTQYDIAHEEFHPIFRDFLKTYGYYDIFIVEPDNGRVIYSVFKEIDYATSLETGPYKNSGLAQAYRQAKAISREDKAVLVDFAPYVPSYSATASFIASPIYNGDKVEAVLIYQMPLDRINYLMTNNQHWKDVGFGDTGETYLVGEDGLLRSEVRFLIEDPEGFSDALLKAGEDNNTVIKMKASGTSVGLLEIKTEGVRNAIANEKGLAYFTDYRNEAVISAYTPVDILGIHWALLSEIDQHEAFAGQEALVSSLITTSIILAIVLISLMAGCGVFLARITIKPVDKFSNTLTQITQNNDLSLRFTTGTKNEFSVLGSALNNLMENLGEFITDMRHTASQLADNSKSLNHITEQTTDKVHQQNEEVNSAATATTEMNSSVHEVARSTVDAAEKMRTTRTKVSESVTIANQTQEDIYQLQINMQSAIKDMEQLESESQSIGEVLDVIQNIAEQTNLLALNAAIEAARAGEQGRGFAVVADEVRTLASRTAQSTDEIRKKIESLQKGVENALGSVQSSQQKTDSSITKVEEAVSNLNEVSSHVDTTDEMNTHIATATEEQSQVTDEINRNMHLIKDLSENILTISQDLKTSSNDIQGISKGIYKSIEQYKV